MQYYRKPYSSGVSDIISYLSDVRKQKGITIYDLSSEFRVYPSCVGRWLNPNSNISLENLIPLGNALGVTFSMRNSKSSDCSAYQLVDLLAMAKEDQKLTTRDLAGLTGITQPSVAGILSHRIVPRLNSFLLLADALDLSLELHTN